MDRQVRYCTSSDGTQIAYSIEGSGPTLIFCPYFCESFATDDALPQWGAFLQQLAGGRQMVRYDMRGTGLSQRDGVEITHENNARDLEAVVEAAGLEQFALFGSVLSAAVAIEYASRYPERVSRMVLYAGFALSTDVMPAEAISGLAALCRSNWVLASQTFSDMSLRAEEPQVAHHQAEIMRQTLSGETLANVLELDLDVTEILPSLTTPTLVLHRVNDSALPFAASQRLASGIPNARLVPLKGTINFPALGDTQSVVDAATAFLDEGRATLPEPEPEPEVEQGAFRTILFTDMVGHTEMMGRLGDEAGRKVLREHERITRETLHAHGGSEVKTMGDGFMASFASATRALECAIAMQRAFKDDNELSAEPISLRVGLNAGEPIAEEDDLFGAAVILAARIAAKAAGGEILVSEAVRQIVAGKQFLFSDRGETALRGFEDPVHVYEVSWQQA